MFFTKKTKKTFQIVPDFETVHYQGPKLNLMPEPIKEINISVKNYKKNSFRNVIFILKKKIKKK